MARVDVVVVSYNSRAHLRGCVEPLTRLPEVRVIVVDNASADASLDSIDDLDVVTIRRAENEGFAAGCNHGWRAGDAPFVLFLNPDAAIEERSLGHLVAVLEHDEAVGLAAPRIEHPDGSLALSQRRFPTLRSTFARAIFLHRLFTHAAWADELIRNEECYSAPASPDWVSGACVLLRRSLLESLNGWDDGFFMYGEDVDICRRLRQLGSTIGFEPLARVVHHAGHSAPRTAMAPVLARSRVRYAWKHERPAVAVLEQAGIGLGALVRVVVSRGGRSGRLAQLRALRVVLSKQPVEQAARLQHG